MSKSVKITMYPAKDGDCFLLEINDIVILIDGGYADTYQNFLKSSLIELSNKGLSLRLLIITHIDNDHITGVQEFINDNGPAASTKIIPIKEIWYNGYIHLPKKEVVSNKITEREREILNNYINISKRQVHSGNEPISGIQGMTLAYYLLHRGYNWNSSVGNKAICTDNMLNLSLEDQVYIRLLSPSLQQLTSLASTWKNELNSKKWSFSLTDDPIFNEAMEAFLLSTNSDMDIVTESISFRTKTNYSIQDLLAVETTNDLSVTNGSSIAFIIEAYGKRLLFLGDAHEDQIINEIKKLVNTKNYTPFFDLIKVSHHGSLKNAKKLYDLIDGRIFLISTDGSRYNHPDLSTLAKIIHRQSNHHRTIVFNYPNNGYHFLRNKDFINQYNYTVVLNTSYEPIIL